MDTDTNYYSPLTKTEKSRTYSLDEKVTSSLSNQSVPLGEVNKYGSVDGLTQLNKKKNGRTSSVNSNNKEIESIILSIRAPSSNNASPSSLFLPNEKEIITTTFNDKKSKKKRKSKNSRNGSRQKLKIEDENSSSELINRDDDSVKDLQYELNKENEKINGNSENNSGRSSHNLDNSNEQKSSINHSCHNSIESFKSKSSQPNLLNRIKEEKIKLTERDECLCKSKAIVEEPESLSNDNTLTTISQYEEKNRINESKINNTQENIESSNADAYTSLEASSVSSYEEDDEVDSTLSNSSYNDGTLSSSQSKGLKNSNSLVKGGVKKIHSFRRKYLSRPIKYSVSSVFKYGVGALSSLFNLRVDDVFGMEEFDKEILKEATLKGVADYIKSGKVKNIIILSGAGISTNAGIPDFRSPKTGLYSKL